MQSTTETPARTRDSWPEIDQLAADAAVQLAAGPSWYAAGKVLFDYVAAALLLPIALPLIALAAVAVKLTSPGPVFYYQTRLGLNGRRYQIIKIRSMHHNIEAKSGRQWSQKGDTRITRVGKFLRASHFDELPQLFNVLKGEMSLVGPRPERPEVIRDKALDQLVPGYRLRLKVKPGVTGLAQVQLPPDSDITSVKYKVVYDLYYVENQSLFFDLRLIGATVFKAAGAGAKALRVLFFLPSRRAVAAGFQNNLSVSDDSMIHELQPA